MATLADAARVAYDTAFQISPIFFTGGIASNAPNGMMPLLQLLGVGGAGVGPLGVDVASEAVSLVSGASLAQLPVRFVPLTGTQIVSNSVGTYPFANQVTAANAVIQQGLQVSMEMYMPVASPGGYLAKLPLFQALQSAFQRHNSVGGTYTVLTPAFMYVGCIMTGISDITHTRSRQQQIEWQITFFQPLVSSSNAQMYLSNLISKLSNGQPVTTPAGVSQLPTSMPPATVQPDIVTSPVAIPQPFSGTPTPAS